MLVGFRLISTFFDYFLAARSVSIRAKSMPPYADPDPNSIPGQYWFFKFMCILWRMKKLPGKHVQNSGALFSN
jgi:hypothetical protein